MSALFQRPTDAHASHGLCRSGCAPRRALLPQMVSSPSALGTASSCPPRPARGDVDFALMDVRPTPTDVWLREPVGGRPDSLLDVR
jgi:hypothetical protein